MSHEIDTSTGKPAIAYVGLEPWHGMGANLDENTPLEQWRVAAGLDWEALSSPVITEINGVQHPIGDRKVLYRSDTLKPLSVVNRKYRPVQPTDVIEFYRDLCAENGYRMQTAGALRGGRIIWALASVPMDLMKVAIPEEEIRPYVLLSTSFDYSSATIVKLCTERVVCKNTLNIAMNEHSRRVVSIPHSRVFDAKAVKIELDLYGAMSKFVDQATRMAETPVTEEEAVRFFLKVYKDDATPTGKRSEERLIARLAEIFRTGPGANLPTAFGTVWGLVNAVTADVDHSIKSRSADNRLSSAWFGPGDRRKQLAFETAKELAGITPSSELGFLVFN